MKTIEIRNGRVFCGDPSYLGSDAMKYGTLLENVKSGSWIIEKQGSWKEPGNALRAVHKDKVDMLHDFIKWDDFVGRAGVDSGLCGVFNPNIDVYSMLEQLGEDYCYESTETGDGYFPVVAKYEGDEVVAIEINYDREAWIYGHHHMYVQDEDIAMGRKVVEEGDFKTYKELMDKYPNAIDKQGYLWVFFDAGIHIGNGLIDITEETFNLATDFECECG